MSQLLESFFDLWLLKYTFDFVNIVFSLTTLEDKYAFSFEVESLFTNIPTLETIYIILEAIFTKVIVYFHGLNKDELKYITNLHSIVTLEFNNEFIDQVDGVSMGSPYGPFFADIFMEDFEKKHMGKLKQ